MNNQDEKDIWTSSSEEFDAKEEIFSGFDREWDDLSPSTSPPLADYRRIKNRQMREAFEIARRRSYGVEEAERIEAGMEEEHSFEIDDISDSVGRSDRLLGAVNLPALPCHHLLSFKDLAATFDSVPAKQTESVYQLSLINPRKKRDLLRKALAKSNVPANEAALLDSPLIRHFADYRGETPFEADWYFLWFDSLQGCAEIYLAEMHLVKRKIYEAGDDLPSSFQISSTGLLAHLPPRHFAPLSGETINRLFIDNLSSSYTLSVASAHAIKTAGKFKPEATSSGKRIDGWMSRGTPDQFFGEDGEREAAVVAGNNERGGGGGGDTLKTTEADEDDEKITYRFRLADYWLGWQRAARLSSFDFDFLQTITSARAVRFYELTKLWRISPAAREGDSLPGTLEIEYKTLTALVPLPALPGEADIKQQIDALIEPLGGAGGYVGSLTIESVRFDETNAGPVLKFRFND